ncbi:hypothetical protein D3C86_2006350 [compost metagenome]
MKANRSDKSSNRTQRGNFSFGKHRDFLNAKNLLQLDFIDFEITPYKHDYGLSFRLYGDGFDDLLRFDMKELT